MCIDTLRYVHCRPSFSRLLLLLLLSLSLSHAEMIGRQRSSATPSSPSIELPFLLVSVSDPVKLGNGVQAYISYRVSTKTNMADYRAPEKIVIRRFSDFVWLQERLAEKYRGVFIPPLPEKSAVEKFRFNAEFIELRRRALDVFVNRIASHPQLQLSEDLQNFLQADEELWAIERARTQEGNVFQKRSGDFMQMFKDVQSKVTDIVLGKDKLIEESDPEYEKLKQYVLQLEDHLGEAQKQSLRLAKRHKDLGQALLDFGKAMKSLGGCEGADLGRAFTELGFQSDLLSSNFEKQGQELMMDFEEPLKEYVRTVQSIKSVMSDRALAFRHQRELAESSKMKQLNLEKLRVVQPHKVFEAEADLKETQTQCEEARKRFEMIVKSMRQEMVRFQEQRTRDMSVVFQKFARAQAQLAKDSADTWRTLLPKLGNPPQRSFMPS